MEKIIPKQRNVGIDALRILSMYMVIILHVQGAGGLVSELLPFSVRYETAWFLESMTFCAVNCYALISGYVGIQTRFKLSNLIYLWLQVVFYCLIITVLFAVINPAVIGKQQILSALFPVVSKQYWYFTAYFALFFLTPFLNRLIRELPRQNAKQLLALLIFLFSLLPTVVNKDLFYTGEGYSPLWLAILYLIGAYLQRYKEEYRAKAGKLIAAYFLFTAFTWISKLVIEKVVYLKLGTVYYGDLFYKYSSPTVLGASVALFLLFSAGSVRSERLKKGVYSLASASFGVYLIHANPLVFKHLLTGSFADFSEYSVVCMIGAVLVTAMVVYLACWVIDTIRRWIFDILRIRQLSVRLESILNNWWLHLGYE